MREIKCTLTKPWFAKNVKMNLFFLRVNRSSTLKRDFRMNLPDVRHVEVSVTIHPKENYLRLFVQNVGKPQRFLSNLI